ncbi:IMP dehydrogenase [Candidatus Gottesmanbacteria bacterium]|nr:IMP dehydrogenase [Candidatus Gottesmanbacteria bacterium]
MNKQSIIENKIVRHEALTFDDILLLPNYSDVKRQDTYLSVKLHPKIHLHLPVLSSPMDTVTEESMAIAMALAGGLGVLHRNVSVEHQASMVIKVKQQKVKNANESAVDSAVDEHNALLVGAAVGVGSDTMERVDALMKAKTDVIVVDSSHGYTKFVIDTVKDIKKQYPKCVLMAGNIATYDGARALIEAGVDILRVGMGPGSICTTRIISGMGVPQISAISAVVRATEDSQATVIADGGIRQIGDMAKALAFGATAVMLGSLLAGYDESPGDVAEIHSKKYKIYRGMGSISAMKKGGAERYGQSRDTDERKLIAEGVEGFVPYKGSVSNYLYQIHGSLRTSLYYLGSKNLLEFFEKSRVIKISNAGLLESHPHDVSIESSGGNYAKK